MKKIALLLMLLGVAGQASAEDYVKNGNPCISGICIGDDIESLIQKNIAWHPVDTIFGTYKKYKNNRQDLDFAKKYLAPQPESNYAKALFYFKSSSNQYQFDGNGLVQLAKIKGFCQDYRATGKFKSENGNETTVSIRLIPSEDGAQQKIKVESVGRQIPSNTTQEQQLSIEAELSERYKDVMRSGSYNIKFANSPSVVMAKNGNLNGSPTWGFDSSGFGIQASLNDRVTYYTNEFLKYPGCSATIKLD